MPPGLDEVAQKGFRLGQALHARVAARWTAPPAWPLAVPPNKKLVDEAAAAGWTPSVLEGGIEAVRDMLDHARRVTLDDLPDLPPGPSSSAASAGDARKKASSRRGDDDTGDAGGGDGGPTFAHAHALPDDFPIRPLGKRDGTYWYLDPEGELMPVPRNGFARSLLIATVADLRYLGFHYPVFDRYGEHKPEGFNTDKCLTHLAQAAKRKGLWSPDDALRGVGAHASADGGLVLHLGDRVLTPEGVQAPGVLGRFVYPADMPQPGPCDTAVPAVDDPLDCFDDPEADNPAALIAAVLGTWHFARGDLDVRLLLGALCAGVVGGAIDWRPIGWITGGFGTGKSSLHKMFKALHGPTALFTENTSAAGITAELRHRTVPVFLDEVEAGEDGRREQQLLETARLMASGGTKLRSDASHGVARFTLRSGVMFSSIRIPPLEPQDKSRMAVFELKALRPGGTMPDLSEARLRPVYGRLVKRMADGFPRLQHVLEQFKGALLKAGHSQRTADVFGTLLAAGEVALTNRDILDQAYLDHWAGLLDASELAETREDDSDELRCLRFLRTSQVDPWKAAHGTVADACGAWRDGHKGQGMALDNKGELPTSSMPGEMIQADRHLASVGLRIVLDNQVEARTDEGPVVPKGELYLAVSNTHEGTSKLFEASPWRRGGWRQSLKRLPGVAVPRNTVRIGGVKGRCVLVPLGQVFEDPDLRAHLRAGDLSASPAPPPGTIRTDGDDTPY